jgi:hypothetical protein
MILFICSKILAIENSKQITSFLHLNFFNNLFLMRFSMIINTPIKTQKIKKLGVDGKIWANK